MTLVSGTADRARLTCGGGHNISDDFASHRGDPDGQRKSKVAQLPVVGPLVVHTASCRPPCSIDFILHLVNGDAAMPPAGISHMLLMPLSMQCINSKLPCNLMVHAI